MRSTTTFYKLSRFGTSFVMIWIEFSGLVTSYLFTPKPIGMA